MTCIVGVIDHKKEMIYIGGDSAGTSNNDIVIRQDPKVFVNGPFIMGFTTSFRMGQLLSSSAFVPSKQKDNQSDFDYMVTGFIDSVRRLFKSNGYEKKETDGESKGGTFLVGYKGVLYKIEGDFQVGISHDLYEACGCGEDYAKGALFHLIKNGKMSIKNKITSSLDAASYHSSAVAPPYKIINMTTKQSTAAAGKLKTLKKNKKTKPSSS